MKAAMCLSHPRETAKIPAPVVVRAQGKEYECDAPWLLTQGLSCDL